MTSSSNLPPHMRGDNPQVARFRPTAQAARSVDPVPLASNIGSLPLPEGGYPDYQEAGLALAAGQRLQARQTENRGALTSGPGDPSTPTMYPTDYGASSTGSPQGASSMPASPAGPGNAAAKAAADNEEKKKAKKKAKRKHRRKPLAALLPPRRAGRGA